MNKEVLRCGASARRGNEIRLYEINSSIKEDCPYSITSGYIELLCKMKTDVELKAPTPRSTAYT